MFLVIDEFEKGIKNRIGIPRVSASFKCSADNPPIVGTIRKQRASFFFQALKEF